jgi:hypothetical protein
MATGVTVLLDEYHSAVSTRRTSSIVNRIVDPVTGFERATRWWTVPPSCGWPSTGGRSAIGSRVTVSAGTPSTSMRIFVGTEWRPSATTSRSRWSKVMASGTVYWIQ